MQVFFFLWNVLSLSCCVFSPSRSCTRDLPALLALLIQSIVYSLIFPVETAQTSHRCASASVAESLNLRVLETDAHMQLTSCWAALLFCILLHFSVSMWRCIYLAYISLVFTFESLPPIPLPDSMVDCEHLVMIWNRLQPARPQIESRRCMCMPFYKAACFLSVACSVCFLVLCLQLWFFVRAWGEQPLKPFNQQHTLTLLPLRTHSCESLLV